MNIVHKDINNEKMIDMWMMDGEEITPVRENIPRKKVLKDVYSEGRRKVLIK